MTDLSRLTTLCGVLLQLLHHCHMGPMPLTTHMNVGEGRSKRFCVQTMAASDIAPQDSTRALTQALGLLLGTEAPIMTPNDTSFSFPLFFLT